MEIKAQGKYLHIDVIEPIGVDNEFLTSFSGCRIKIVIEDLKTIKSALNILAAGNMGAIEIVTGRPEITFLTRDESTGLLVETDYVDGGEELICGHAIDLQLSADGTGLLLGVKARPKYSSGRYYSTLGVIPNEAFDWKEVYE